MNHNTNILGYRNLPEGLRHTGWEPLSYGVMFLIHKNGETNSIYLMEFTGRYKEIQFTFQLRAGPELIAVGIYLGWVKTGITAGSRGNLEIALPGGDACVLIGRDRRRLVGGRQRREVGLPGFHTSAPGVVVHICPYSLLSKDSEIFLKHQDCTRSSYMEVRWKPCHIPVTAVCPGECIAPRGCGLCRDCRPQCPGGQSVCRLTCVTLGQGWEQSRVSKHPEAAFLSFTPGFLFDNIEVGSPSRQSAETQQFQQRCPKEQKMGSWFS